MILLPAGIRVRDDFVARMVQHGMAVRHLAERRHVIMLRRGSLADYQRGGVAPTAEDAPDVL